MLATRDAGALYAGLMSGTSVDGIDAVLCRFTPHADILACLTHPWPAAVRADILEMAQSQTQISLDDIGHLDSVLGQCFAEATLALLARAKVAASDVRAVGSHGQTIRHRPDGRPPFTWQLGNPWIIAEHGCMDVVADFRRADMAAGGQGAPLMPAFHAAMLGTSENTRAVLNLGGIANLTVLSEDGGVRGFDTGPANALMDAWCLQHTGQTFDRDGSFAAQGHVDAELLSDLLTDPYFAVAPPKSTGREHFHLDWLRGHPRVATLQAADIQATLRALTVNSVADAVHRDATPAREILVCGGGVHNPILMTALATALAPREVVSTATLGIDPDYLEAMGFAWLARQRILGLPGNLPSVTGASGLRVLGSVHRAPERPI